jgi:hypothetical protein
MVLNVLQLDFYIVSILTIAEFCLEWSFIYIYVYTNLV